MNTKKLTGILILTAMLMLSMLFPVAVNAETTTTTPTLEPTDNVTITSVTVSGSANNQMTQTITLNAGRDGFASITAGTNVSGWFTNLPAASGGLTAKAKGCATGALTLQIEISGKPTVANDPNPTPITIEIPLKYLKNAWVSNAPHSDYVGAENINVGTTSTNTTMTVDSNPDAVWDIKKTYKVIYSFDSDYGTVTATGGTFTKVGNDYVGYVVDETKLTFKAAPKAGYGVISWTITNAVTPADVTETEQDLTRSRIIDGDLLNDGDEVTVEVNFGETWTAYRIKQVTLGEDYIVKQTDDDGTDEIVVTKLVDGVPVVPDSTEDEDEDETVMLTFGTTKPIVLKKADIDVSTNWKPELDSVGKDSDGFALVPENAKEYKFTVSSSKPGVVKAELITSSNLKAYTTEFEKYGEAAGLTPPAVGDLVITPQGVGTTAITITAKNDTSATPANTVKLNEGKIIFDITVEAAETAISLDTEAGTVTATTNNLYGTALTFTLDFTKETASISGKTFKIEGYSLNGSTWTSFSIGNTTPADISKILDKKGTDVKFAEKLTSGKPSPGSAVWAIGAIESRPKTPSLKVFYGDPNGEEPEDMDTNTWTVTGFDFESDESAGLVFASSKDGKTPDIPASGKESDTFFGFMPFDLENEDVLKKCVVKDLPKDEKVLKSVYFFRIAAILQEADKTSENSDEEGEPAYILTPASKSVKVTVSSQTKPAKIKVDYKKERVFLKANMAYQFGSMTTSPVTSKADAKLGIPFKDDESEMSLLNGSANASLTYWVAANGKKPRSKAETVTIYNYSKWSYDAAIKGGFDKTKHIYKLPKGYEARPFESEGRWVTSIKQVSSTTEYEVRKKGTAKFDAKGKPWLKAGTQTASEIRKLTIIVDEYKAGKDKNGEDIIKTDITRVTVEQIAP